MEMDIEKKVIEIINEVNPYVDVTDETNLIEEEVLGSYEILILLTKLEEEFGIELPLEKIEIEDFMFAGDIAKLVKRNIEQ